MIDGFWLPSHQADPRAIGLYLRHYSARHYRDGRARRQFCPPGEKMVLLTVDCQALWVWHRPTLVQQHERKDGQLGVCCVIFRNEGDTLSSLLVGEADEFAFRRWPGERHFTYVWDARVRHKRDPGRCFRKAGWRVCGRNKDGRLTILERLAEAA